MGKIDIALAGQGMQNFADSQNNNNNWEQSKVVTPEYFSKVQKTFDDNNTGGGRYSQGSSSMINIFI